MLYLEQTRNRILLMIVFALVSIVMTAALIPGINAVGIMLVVVIVNSIVYYALPGKYSTAYMQQYSGRYCCPSSSASMER